MSMIKRATGKIEKFTNADGEEVEVDNSVVCSKVEIAPVNRGHVA